MASVKPDYELRVQDVCTQLTANSLLAHDAIHILYHAQDPSLTRLKGLPSWVPDFGAQLVPYLLRFCGDEPWSACVETCDSSLRRVTRVRIGVLSLPKTQRSEQSKKLHCYRARQSALSSIGPSFWISREA